LEIREEEDITKRRDDLLVQALVTLYQSPSNRNFHTAALDSLSELNLGVLGGSDSQTQSQVQNSLLLGDLQEALFSCFNFATDGEARVQPGHEVAAVRYAETFLQLQIRVPRGLDPRFALCWDYLQGCEGDPTAMALGILGKSAQFFYVAETYIWFSQEVDDQAFINICLGEVKLSAWIWAELMEEVTQRNFRESFNDDAILTQTVTELLNALPSDSESDKYKYIVMVLHSLGCGQDHWPEAQLDWRGTRTLLEHALTGMQGRCAPDVLQRLSNLLTQLER